MVGVAATHAHDDEFGHGHNEHEPQSHELLRARGSAPARVTAGKYVTINYTLRTNGAIRHIRSAVWGDEPLEYLQGDGRLLPALERALEGKAAGDRVVAILPPEEAYGERDKALQQRVAAEEFGGADQLEAGMCFLAQTEDGRRVENVMITEVDEENGFAIVDTNHPLAGMTLEFDVTVVAVRDAPSTAGCGTPQGPGIGHLVDGLAKAQ
jgi:FKBP-type peptidyl-prolyl cis-trans isomerase SlyD